MNNITMNNITRYYINQIHIPPSYLESGFKRLLLLVGWDPGAWRRRGSRPRVAGTSITCLGWP